MTTAERVLAALQPYKLKQEGQGKYRANSPLRPGADSHSFRLKIEADGEHGAWIDETGGMKGSLYELADRLNIDTPRAKVENSKREYRDLDDYAAAHGVTADVMKAAGWSDKRMVYDHDHGAERPALVFQTEGGERYRFIDGLKPSYKSKSGYKPCLYGMKQAPRIAREKGMPLILCNGEVSTVVAQSLGLPAACVTNGEKKYPNELVQKLLTSWDGDFWIAMDCDDTGRGAAREVSAQLVGRNVTIIDLGLTDAGDLADFCKLFTDTAADELRKRAVALPKDEPAPVSDTALLAQSIDALKSAIRQDDKAKAAQDLETLIAKAQGEIDRIATHISRPKVLSFEEVAARNLAKLEWAMQNPEPIQGLRSKIGALDKAVGGFTPEMYVIYGATNMGKSTLAVSITREFVHQAPGFIASTESHPDRWMTKLVASLCGISSDRIEGGQLNRDEYRMVKQKYEWLAIMKCHFLESGSPTVSMLRASLLDGKEKYGYEWGIVDSASKMEHPGAYSIYDTTRGVASGLQSLWQEADLPLIVTSQVGRDVAERPAGKKLPQLEDGYGGGTIEQNAGVVMALYNHNYYVARGTEEPHPDFPENTALVRILKNRWHGGSQVNAVMLRFVGGAGFYELETRKVSLEELSTNGKH